MKKPLRILGISAFFHDSSATLIVDGVIVAAAQEERFTRVKHTADFPINAVKYCLQTDCLELSDIDAIVFFEKPLLKFERLLETYWAFSPYGIKSFLKAMPVWIKEKLFPKKMLYDGLSELISKQEFKKIPLLFSEHHLSHAASAFFPSPFEESAIVVIDGVGEWNTVTISYGKGNSIRQLKEVNFPHSLGLLYSAFTYFLGFMVNSGEYKLMGLAPYGDENSPFTHRFIEIIKSKLITIYEDGAIWLNPKYFSYATSLRMVDDQLWEKLFGIERRNPDDPINQKHCDLALAIQRVTEEVLLKIVKEARRITGSKNLCLSGGVALNCVANGKIRAANIFDQIFIQPASGDAGGSLGAALAVNFIYFERERTVDGKNDALFGSYLGPQYSDKEIELMIGRMDAISTRFNDTDELCEHVATLIAEGKVIGWFQGRMEFGPRALGNRSILGDPRNHEMQKNLNLKIKYREGFRPFAPSILEEDVDKFFDTNESSPYMLFVAPFLKEKRYNLPDDYYSLSIMERLYIKRSDLQSITHCDFSARIQTVKKSTNEKYWKLLTAFKNIAGIGVLVNTSFNVRGEPIVCSPMDAYRCFMNTEMDYLVIENYLFQKNQQPEFDNKEKWKLKFKND